MSTYPRNEYLGVRVNSEVKKIIERNSKNKNISVGEYVNIAILTYMNEHKFLADVCNEIFHTKK